MMIAILNNFINFLMLQAGFILVNIIHVLHTPVSAFMAVSLLAYLEYITIKSIVKDMRPIAKQVSYIFSLIYLCLKGYNTIFKNINTKINNTINALIALNISIRKLAGVLMGNRYVFTVMLAWDYIPFFKLS